jgi:hypothetical protein
MSFTFEPPAETEIAHPELVNTYKIDGQEVTVITGKDPKCPPGYKIIKTNINDKESGVKVIICSKGDLNSLQLPTLSVSPIPTFLDNQHFPFSLRDDAFDNLEPDDEDDLYKECYFTFEIIIFLIAFIYLENLKNIKSDAVNIVNASSTQ